MRISYPTMPAGTIFTITYTDVNTNLGKKGLFLVYYDESLDNKNGNRNDNINCFKLTTNPFAKSGHSFRLSPSNHTFLSRECWILSTKSYVFHKKFVENVLGVVDTNTLTDFFYNCFAPAQLTMSQQLINKIKINGGIKL